MDYSRIVLEPEQQRLFSQLVEIARSVPRDERMKFFYIKSHGGNLLRHQPSDTQMEVYEGDLESLVDAGLLRPSFGSRGTNTYDVTPIGFLYYEHLHSESSPVNEIENEIWGYLDADSFRQRYPDAYAKWERAAENLWSSDSPRSFTEIGHNCREALQFFANSLCERLQLNVEDAPSKTVSRLRRILAEVRSGESETVTTYLDALLPLWGATSDLVQRQEHGAQKEGEELVWEDARRVVFSTAYAMFEIDRACD